MNQGQIKKFEVFTTPLCDGFICDNFFTPNINQVKDVIDQLFSGLGQLVRAHSSHNDLKPGNILYLFQNNKYIIKIGDFGQCGKKGGTPGWTAPIFLEDRRPGREDMYSLGLVILRLLCDDEDLFYCLRDNYVHNTEVTKQWMIDFKNLTEIKFITRMMDLENQPTITEIENEWNRIKAGIRMIDVGRLLQRLSVPPKYLQLQYNHTE